jgi:hypothetical protein
MQYKYMFWRLVVFEVYHTAGTRYRELFGNKGPVVCHCEQRQGAEPCFHFDLSKHQMSDEPSDRIIKRSFRDAFDGVSAAPLRTQERTRASGYVRVTRFCESYPTKIGRRW